MKTLNEIDESIRELVRMLNTFPGVVTFASCGGHKEKSGKHQSPEGSFYIAFEVEQNPKGWRSLALIASACCWMSGTQLRAFYYGDDEGFSPQCLSFQIEGNKRTDRKKLLKHLTESLTVAA